MSNNLISYNIPQHRVDPGTRRAALGFNDSDFRTDVVGNSDCNMFIPVLAVMAHTLLEFEGDVTARVLEYSMPIAQARGGTYRQYNVLVDNLFRTHYPTAFLFKINGVEHKVFVHRGILYNDQGEILLALGINTEYAMSTSLDVLNTTIDPTKYVLFINNAFNGEIYKNLRKKIEALYVAKCTELGIDVVHTNRIKDWVFKNNLQVPTFRNIMEMNKHLREEVPANLLID